MPHVSSEITADVIRLQDRRALHRYELLFYVFVGVVLLFFGINARLGESSSAPRAEWIAPERGRELAMRVTFLRAMEAELAVYDRQLAAEYPPANNPLGLDEDRRETLRRRVQALQAEAEGLRSTEVAAPAAIKAGLALALGTLREDLAEASPFFNSDAE